MVIIELLPQDADRLYTICCGDQSQHSRRHTGHQVQLSSPEQKQSAAERRLAGQEAGREDQASSSSTLLQKGDQSPPSRKKQPSCPPACPSHVCIVLVCFSPHFIHVTHSLTEPVRNSANQHMCA